MIKKRFRVSPKKLRRICDPKVFRFKSTAHLKPLDTVIGQDRAVQAIEFGLDMKSPGYNIFVTGEEGTGKSTLVREIAQEHARKRSTPGDWCMVNNFNDEYCPDTIPLPPGKATGFAKQMARLIDELREALPDALNGEAFRKKRAAVQKKISRQQHDVFRNIERLARERDLSISRTDTGFETVPVIDGKPLSQDDYRNLSKERRQEIERNVIFITEKIEEGSREINLLTQALHDEIERLLDEETLSVVKVKLDTLRTAFKQSKEVLGYLDAVQDDIVENVQVFLRPEDKDSNPASPGEDAYFKKYRINVLVDRKGTKGAPVVFEPNPTYSNVFGQIEKRAFMGSVTTDFNRVQPGSLLQANGGYLIMEVEPVLTNNFVWDSLKRALRNKCLAIEDMATEMGFVTASLRPKPIPLEVKVILIGGYYPFQILQNYDPHFNKLFRVRADFDYEVSLTAATVRQYAKFIARISQQEELLPFNARGVARIVEFGSKTVADQAKLSLRFGPLLGLIKESDYWARRRKGRVVTEKDVAKALAEYRYRYNLYEEKIHEAYVDKTILIDVKGSMVGQVNALAVYQIGDISFGRPSRITAETYMGKQGIVNIEREAKLSGKTHDKGVLILSGYLGRTFAQRHPLNLSISITFEQSYGGIDGDSASSTELYAILSSLAQVPIRQGIAVTGSVNQKGMVQAIGGVNQKIEGFFEVCQSRGLTGSQGVMIPEANVDNLMLKSEVVNAVKRHKFHIYRVSRIQEGIELLTGIPAGKADTDGNYPPDTVYGRVQTTLAQYYRRSLQRWKDLESNDIEAGTI
ncbi:ATP-dependent protease La (EC Type II [Olavius algarvensis associated proteobacterium Delta 3]|nr:ATP-dependent protease La (EC Type II [Olavius algarvensis associated proteobacterium Delta 3]CAB5169379.1 ATP-dependent protease La (EC Type II [Olavius algarvensis associated proteobacterium Delta 3]